MNKMNITVSKKMTINTGNYSSIQPSVSIEMKDVYVDDVERIYEHTENIASAFLIKEIASLGLLQDGIKKVGVSKLIENVDKDKMNEDLKNSIEEISGDI